MQSARLRYDGHLLPRGLAKHAMISPWILLLLLLGLVYSLVVSVLAWRETGKLWMLFLPQWLDASSGVSRRVRLHGQVAFGLLLVATILFFYSRA